MNWFIFCYWYEPDAPQDPVGLVRIWALAEALSKAGQRITLFPPRYRSARNAGVQTVLPVGLVPIPLLRPLSYALGSFLRGAYRAVAERPQVVYYRWMASPHAVILAKLLGACCVCEVNGEPVPAWSPSAGFGRTLRRWLARAALRHCDRVVVLTDGLGDLLVRQYGVPPERLIVLPSGTDTDCFAPRNPEQCRRELGLPVDGAYVGFVGTLYRYQGVSTLLEAMVTVRGRCPQVRMLVVGDGEAAQELKEQARTLGLDDIVIWAGRVPYLRVPTYIGAMTLCAAPFRADRGETSPVKIIDGLACGRPVVASAITSVQRVFAAGSGVRFVEPDNVGALAEAIEELLHSPAVCARLGEEGRRFVERRFSWASLADRLQAWLISKTSSHHAHSALL